MSAAEIASRIAAEVRGIADRRGRRAWTPRPPVAEVHRVPVGFLTQDRARALPAAMVISTIDRARGTREGRFAFFGYPEVRIAEVGAYAIDPITGGAWPNAYGPSIDYRNGAYGDPKWIWELNRLQHLPVWIQAWLVTGDPSYAADAAAAIEQWIASTPVGRGIAWANGFEAGLRGISLALCWDAMRGSGIQTDEERDTLLLSLWQHGRWIRRRPSSFSSANNHLVGECAGLTLIALLAPELPESEVWVREGLAGLVREADRQILKDGVGAEQAFGYTVFVLDLLLLVVAVLDAQRESAPSELLGALERGGRALAALIEPGEPEPTFGDYDEGRAAILDANDRRNARDLLAGIACRTGTPGLVDPNCGLDAASRWLFGSLPLPAGGIERHRSVALRNGGIVVLRDKRRRAIFDTGPLGYLSLAAHGHADALQVALVDNGLEVIVDPGTGSYFGDPAIRRSFRGTAAHATVCVDGRDQAEQRGPFLWTNHYSVSVEYLDLARNLVVAHHDGYARLNHPVTHRRTVSLEPDLPLIVYDQLVATGRHEYVQTWPLAPALAVEQIAAGAVRLTHPSGCTFVLALAASEDAQLELVRGSWSSRLESLESAWVCRWRFPATGGGQCVAALTPGSDRPVSLAVALEGGLVEPKVVVELDGKTLEYVVGPEGSGLGRTLTEVHL
jgi:hypothetical protein